MAYDAASDVGAPGRPIGLTDPVDRHIVLPHDTVAGETAATTPGSSL